MQRIIKAGALILVLVVPALVFLFLRFFGENHFSLKTYYPLTNPSTGDVLVQSSPDAAWWESPKDTVFYTVPSFTLSVPPKDSTSGRLKLKSTKDFKDKLLIVSFTGAVCDQTCLQTAGQISRILDIFNKDQEIVALTLMDHLSAARPLRHQWGNMPDRWTFGQPTHKSVQRVADYEFRFNERPIINPKKETFAYNEGFILVDKEGHIRGYYKSTDKAEVDRLILEIRVLLDIYTKNIQTNDHA
jgi:protein SCO1